VSNGRHEELIRIDREPLPSAGRRVAIDRKPFGIVCKPFGIVSEPLGIVRKRLAIDRERFGIDRAGLAIDREGRGSAGTRHIRVQTGYIVDKPDRRHR